MSSLRLHARDYLGVELVEKTIGENLVRRFHLRARALTAKAEERQLQSERFNVNGTLMWDHWSGPSPEAVAFLNPNRVPKDGEPSLTEFDYDKRAKRYTVAVTDTNVVVLTRAWGLEKMVFVSPETRAEFMRLLQEFNTGEAVAIQAAKFKLDGTVPPLPQFWQERKDAPLSPYQRAAVKLSLDVPGLAWFMDRGTGKTPCAIQRTNMLAIMLERGEIDGGGPRPDGGRMLRTLVVVPKNVRINWQREFEKFSHVHGKVTVMRGGLHRRIAKLAEACKPENGLAFSVLICGYDMVRTTIKFLTMFTWDDVITDESHNYKDPNTDRFKTLVQLRDVASRRRASLTGTPIGNSPMDLWAQLEFLRQGGSGFTTHKAFKAFHGVWVGYNKGAYGVQKLVGLQHIPLLQERLARMSFSISKDEAGLHLPSKVYTVEEVQMTPYQAEVYDKLQDELALEIEDKLSKKVQDQVTIKNVLTMLLRLAQVTSGFITYDAKWDMDTGDLLSAARREELSQINPKCRAALDWLTDSERDPKAKAIIWCHFIHNIETMSRYLTDAGIVHGCYHGAVPQDERDRLVDQFNCNPDFKVLVCNPQTAGEGLNLLGYDTRNPDKSDTYCNLEIFLSQGWSAILRAQAEDRAHRRGTRMPVQIVDLVVPGTIDEEIMDRVRGKLAMAATVGDLRATLGRVLGRKVEQDAA